VFAGRLLGDGMAVDPTTGILCAPCAGEVITLPDSGHAISLRTSAGVEVLIHIGIDTVELKGRGFTALVKVGDRVAAGDRLILFDLDVVARGAKSLLTPIVVAPEGAVITGRHATAMVRSGQLLFEVEHDHSSDRPGTAQPGARTTAPTTATAATSEASSHTLIIALRQGLHARPAALLAQRAKTFVAEVSLAAHGRRADARSVVSIMALGVRHGDALSIEARGADATRAIAAVLEAIEAAAQMESAGHGVVSATTATVAVNSAARAQSTVSGELTGVTAVAGFAVGRATRLERRAIEVTETATSAEHERAELERARNNARRRLQRVAAAGDITRREIINAHLEFLDDPALHESALSVIATGKSAAYAWRSAIRHAITSLEVLDDSRLRERADDLLDVEAHVLLALAGEARPMTMPLPDQAILIAEDLLPSEFTALDRQRLIGICLGGGGATSHVAILAAAMEIPMLVGVGGALSNVADGTAVILDADAGRLRTQPSAVDIDLARAAVEARLLRSAELRSAAQTACRSLEGTRIEVFANLGNISDAIAAVAGGAEGCGLLRTEFLFIDRETAPTEAEQLEAYQAIANTLGERPLILRLMDVGGDKPLRYLPLPHEDNPALGLRGVRTALRHPDLLRTQLRAALRVVPTGKVRVLIPMVTEAMEIRAVRDIIATLRVDLKLPINIELGAMIETPAAALSAVGLLLEVDFLSIGSNDLTQYTLAMDRGHPELARRTDALHPAVLQLMAATAGAGMSAGKMVAVCGGVAADRLAVPILLGLGVRELSVVPAAIPEIKRLIGGLSMLDCRELALRCLNASSAAEVRELAEKMLVKVGETR
jgi:phosphoenolpyruvate-protein phosphotransferase